MRFHFAILAAVSIAVLGGCAAESGSKNPAKPSVDPAETIESKMDIPAALDAKVYADEPAPLTAYYKTPGLMLNPNVFYNQGRVTIEGADAKALYEAFAIENPDRYTNNPGWMIRDKAGRHWDCRYVWKPGTSEESYVCQFGIDYTNGTAAPWYSNVKTENWWPGYQAYKRKPRSYSGNQVTMSGGDSACDATVKLIDDDARALYWAMTAVEAKETSGVFEKTAPNMRCLKGPAEGGVIYSCRISLDCWTGELKPLSLQ